MTVGGYVISHSECRRRMSECATEPMLSLLCLEGLFKFSSQQGIAKRLQVVLEGQRLISPHLDSHTP